MWRTENGITWHDMTWASMAKCLQKTTVPCFALPMFARWHDLRLNHFPNSKSWLWTQSNMVNVHSKKKTLCLHSWHKFSTSNLNGDKAVESQFVWCQDRASSCTSCGNRHSQTLNVLLKFPWADSDSATTNLRNTEIGLSQKIAWHKTILTNLSWRIKETKWSPQHVFRANIAQK